MNRLVLLHKSQTDKLPFLNVLDLQKDGLDQGGDWDG